MLIHFSQIMLILSKKCHDIIVLEIQRALALRAQHRFFFYISFDLFLKPAKRLNKLLLYILETTVFFAKANNIWPAFFSGVGKLYLIEKLLLSYSKDQ